MTDEQRFKMWNEWLKQVYDDVTDLLLSRYIFREVQKMIEANPAIRRPSAFYQWMAGAYVDSQVMGVRRHTDTGDDVMSLVRLLDDIRRNPHVLSRERFVALYGLEMRDAGEKEFDREIGEGAPHVDPRDVQQDATALRRATENLNRWATGRVAHLIDAKPERVPTFGELDDVLDLMEGLLAKYRFRICALTYSEPVWQYDWKAIFREPWLM